MDKEINPGDLVWGKVESHPWWPGVVCDDPTVSEHVKTNHRGTFYNLQFLSNPPSRGWVKDKNLREFQGIHTPDCQKGGAFYCTKKSFAEALEEAEKAEKMTTSERLAMVLNGDQASDEWTDIEDTTYVIGESKIPSHWQTVYVLITTNIPEDLTPKDSIRVTADGQITKEKTTEKKAEETKTEEKKDMNAAGKRKRPAKAAKPVVESEEEVEMSDEEEFMEDSEDEFVANADDLDEDDEDIELEDEEDDWAPPTKHVVLEFMVDSEDEFVANADDLDEDDEDIELEDEEDDWAPPTKKKKMEFTSIKPKKKYMATALKSTGKKPEKPAKPTKPAKPAKPSVSLTKYNPPKLVEEGPAITTASAPQTSSHSSGSSKPIVITNLEATGEEPSIGDFLLEKAECKDGNVPFLWRFKKGGLIQKYEKMTEDGKTFYQNILSFSDWWSCYANRYQKVETKVIFRYKNVEKVELINPPSAPDTDSSTEGKKDNPGSQQAEKNASENITDKTSENTGQNTGEKPSEKTSGETSSDKSASGDKEQANKSAEKDQASKCAENANNSAEDASNNDSNEKTQEEVVSSTTPDFSEFQIGKFVLDKKDIKNVDGFPMWKIESGILLRKYEAVVKNGNLYHQPTKTYRGYKDTEIGKFYNPLKTKKVFANGQDYMEVLEECRPKVVIDSNTEKEFDQHPLLHHFYVYLQAYLSQALEEGFLQEIKESQDETFVFPMSEINKIVNQKIVNLERKVRWTQKLKKALQKSPCLRHVYKPDKAKTCEAVVDSTESVEHNVFLYGPLYDEDTMTKSDSPPCQEFKVGTSAVENIGKYHNLCHFKYNLMEMCLAKIKLIRERNKKADVTEVMDACLGNKAWVLQNFSEFMEL